MPSTHPNHSTAVGQLQRHLRQLSHHEPSIPYPPIDGIFESRTDEALREFQRLRGLPVTGAADAETWERLYADYRASLAENGPPRPVNIFPIEPYDYEITAGSIGLPVAALQYMLLELQQIYYDLGSLTPSGVYDDATARAVRVVQSKNRIPETGKIDALTWNTITDQFNSLVWREQTE